MTYPVKVTNFLAYVASDSVGGAVLATTSVKAGATAGAGPGGFQQCLYLNGVPRGPSYLCSLLLCSFLGLLLTEAKILDNSDCLTGETQNEHLYQFGSTLFVEARETKVRYPIVTSKL